MALTLEIAGVEKEFIQGTFTNEKSAYNRAVVAFAMRSDGSYRPGRDDEVEIRDGATVKFAGFVETVDEEGYGGEPISEINLIVRCTDVNSLTDRAMLVQTFFVEGTTLLQALDQIADYMAVDGVTLDPAQVTGPTLPYIAVPSMSTTDFLDLITRPYGYIWEIDYNRVLRAFIPGTNPAPFNVIDGTDPTFGDIKVEDSTALYANRVIGRFGTGDVPVIDEWVGDGATSVFGLNYYPLLVHYGVVNIGGTIVNNTIVGGYYETLGDATATWSYNPFPAPIGTVGQITRNAGPVAAGVPILMNYISQMPVVVIASQTSEQPPIRDVVLDLPHIFNRAQAEAAVAAALAGYVAQPKTVRYSTYTTGLAIGQSQTVTVAKRGLNAVVGYIAEIAESHIEGSIIRHDVTWIQGSNLLAYWGDIYHEWSDMGGGGGTVTAPPVVTAVGPGAPNQSVQFNRNGAFGGDAEFTYDENTNSVVCGSGSSITAVSPQSCQVFGVNCHIAD